MNKKLLQLKSVVSTAKENSNESVRYLEMLLGEFIDNEPTETVRTYTAYIDRISKEYGSVAIIETILYNFINDLDDGIGRCSYNELLHIVYHGVRTIANISGGYTVSNNKEVIEKTKSIVADKSVNNFEKYYMVQNLLFRKYLPTDLHPVYSSDLYLDECKFSEMLYNNKFEQCLKNHIVGLLDRVNPYSTYDTIASVMTIGEIFKYLQKLSVDNSHKK